jgi:hypothetical protein
MPNYKHPSNSAKVPLVGRCRICGEVQAAGNWCYMLTVDSCTNSAWNQIVTEWTGD